MEAEQIDKRVSWLDEQRRKDAEEITRLDDRIEQLDQVLKQQSRHVRDLGEEVARISALDARVHQYDETIGKHRQEINQQLEDQEQRRIAREKQLESLRKADRKTAADELDGMMAKLKGLKDIQESLEGRKREELRISRELDRIGKKLDMTSGELREEMHTGLQEARRQDAERINELESRGTDLAKKTDRLRGSMESAGAGLLKLETRAGAIEASEKELRQSQALWSEQQAARLSEFDRAWKNWEKRFSSFEQQAGQLNQRMEEYDETYRGLRLLRDELKDVSERLERRISEVTEMRRLSDDRFKHDWSTFEADEQKRWSSFRLNIDEQWKEHQRLHGSLQSEVAQLQEQMEASMTKLDELERSSKQKVGDLMTIVQEWAAEVRASESRK